MFCKENTPIGLKNDNFRECVMVISYPIRSYKEEYLKLLGDFVCDKSLLYDTDKKKYLALIDNYLLSCNGRVLFLGDSPFLEFRLSFPSYNSLGTDVLRDVLLFIKDIIYNALPFDDDRVKEVSSIIKGNIDRGFKDAFWYYDYMNDKIIDEDNFLVSSVTLNPSLLDDVNGDNLFSFYKNIIKNPPFIFLAGDIEEGSIDIIKDVFLDGKICDISFDKRYNHFCKRINDNVNVIREVTSFKTSSVYYNYKVKNMEGTRDRVLLSAVGRLISSSDSDVLFNTLREENNLVYRCNSSVYGNFGCLVIKSFTDKKNIDLVCSLYKDVIDKVSDVNYIESKLPLFIERSSVAIKLKKESIWNILFTFIDKFFEFDMDDYLDILKDITPMEISSFIKNRLILTDIYIGEGDMNE